MKNTIKVQRAIHDLTQGELAEKVGVSKWTISQMELNNYKPSVLLASKIAYYFKVPVETIFILEDHDLATIAP